MEYNTDMEMLISTLEILRQRQFSEYLEEIENNIHIEGLLDEIKSIKIDNRNSKIDIILK
jgi:hypothetical protein